MKNVPRAGALSSFSSKSKFALAAVAAAVSLLSGQAMAQAIVTNAAPGGVVGSSLVSTGTGADLALGTGNVNAGSLTVTGTAGTANSVTGATGNTVTAVTGDNTITATTGNNNLVTVGAAASNNIVAIGATATNNMVAGGAAGANNITAASNLIQTTSGNVQLLTNDTTGLTGTANGANLNLNAGTASVLNNVSSGLNSVGNTATVQGGTGVSNLVVTNNTSSVLTGGSSAPGASSVALTQGQALISSSGTAATASQMNLTNTSASLSTAAGGGSLTINNQNNAVLTGGSAGAGSSLTLDNSGARLSGPGGAPARLTGIAAGTGDTDAVNMGQVRGMESMLSRGVASVTAAANIPNTDAGKTFSFGLGAGHFNGYNAVAVGGGYRAPGGTQIKASLSLSGSEKSVGVGAGWSW